MNIKIAMIALAGVIVASAAPFAVCAPALADDANSNHSKAGKPAKGGGAHIAPKSGGGAGIAAGLFGAALGATVIDALSHASDPDAPAPAAASPAGCHYEKQALFDASGQQVATRRVRVCN